jgi:hypothetical protein
LALVLGRAPATISAGPLPGVARKALFRIGLTFPVWHMALLLFAPVIVISSHHENVSSEWLSASARSTIRDGFRSTAAIAKRYLRQHRTNLCYAAQEAG